MYPTGNAGYFPGKPGYFPGKARYLHYFYYWIIQINYLFQIWLFTDFVILGIPRAKPGTYTSNGM